MNNLTVKQLKAIEFDGKPKKYTDGAGLFLLVTDKGKYWRLNYRHGGKQKTISLGVYPEVGLLDARDKRDSERKLISQGVDPSSARRAQKATTVTSVANTVELVAREWFVGIHQKSVGEATWARNISRLERFVFPRLGRRPIGEVTPVELLGVLTGISKAESAHRVKQLCGMVWRYAVITGRARHDICADLRDALPPVPKDAHFAAVTSPEQFGALLRAIDKYDGTAVTCAALKLAPLLFVRPNELRHMEWSAIDFDARTWDYLPSKGGLPMYSPLSRQAIEILRDIQQITGRGKYVFPSSRGKGRPISENTICGALARLDYKGVHTAHGFRAAARTMLDEKLGYPIQIIEMQLGHAVKDANGRAYNRTTYIEQRTEMMQRWSDWCDALKANRGDDS